jgi:hypothetical protein
LQAGNAVSFFGYGLILPFEIIYLHQIRGFATATASARVPGARCGARNIGVRNSTLTERSDLVCRGLLLRGPPVVSVAMAWAVRGALELAAAFGSRCRGPGRYHWPARPRNRGKRKGLSPGLEALTAGPASVTTKRSKVSWVNGAVPTTIIVAGLALTGYALVMTARNRRMSVPLLAAVGVLEILLLVQVGIIVARLAGGERPAGLATLIGYLIAMPLVPVAAAFWGLMERSRWGPAVIAVAGLVAAVLMVRLHQIWPVIHV